MLEKKLVTLACAAGILACGACFLPPPQQHPPTPPPVRRGLEGVHELRVEVANVSKSHRLEASALAAEVANIVRAQSHGRITAHISKEAGDGDAVLRIVISNENATPVPRPGESEMWRFEIGTAATLTRTGGALVWTASDQVIDLTQSPPGRTPENVWDDPGVTDRLLATIANRLVFPMLFGQ